MGEPAIVLSPRLTGNLLTSLSIGVWASGFPVTEHLLETWGPLPLVPARLLIASAVLIGIMLVTGRGGELLRVPWRRAVPIGFFGVACSTCFLIPAQAYSDPVTVSIISTGVPLAAAIMAIVAGDETINGRILAGVGLAILGGVVATLAAARGGLGFRGGEVIMLGSVVLFTWYSRSLVRRLPELSDIAAPAVTLGCGGLLILPFILVAGHFDLIDSRTDYTPGTLGPLFWMGGIAVGFTMVMWRAGMRLLGVTVAAIHQNSVPFWVMLFVLLAGGEVYFGQLWGAFFLIAGVLLAQLPVGAWWPARRRDGRT